MIADLIDQDGEARAVALAERFGVTPATVNNTVKRLERDGYVTSKPYRAIFLTDDGPRPGGDVQGAPPPGLRFS